MRDVTVEDIYIGNGVSELIVQAMQALLNSGDEMLVPARTTRCGRRRCRFPAAKRCTICVTNPLTGSRIWTTSAQNHTAHPRIVIINPNNPTGAVYSKELLQEIVEIARQHNLIIFADEIYDKILYDEAQHHSLPPGAGPADGDL